jgi:hypothetical protein
VKDKLSILPGFSDKNAVITLFIIPLSVQWWSSWYPGAEPGGGTVPSGLLAMLLGCVLIYSCIFATGYYIYGDYNYALSLTGVAIVSGLFLIRTWKKIRTNLL